MAEADILDWFRQRAAETAASAYANFLGAGAYHHYRPVVIDTLISRGEFFTAYTPVPAGDLAGNAAGDLRISDDDLRADRHGGGERLDVRRLDRRHRGGDDGGARDRPAAARWWRAACIRNTARCWSPTPGTRACRSTEVPFLDTGRVDAAALEKAITDDTACVLIQSPNFFGTIEDVAAVAEIAHRKGALLVVAIAEAVSLGIVKPPPEADIVAMEAQSFGVPLSFGGPYAGVIATKEKFVRQMPGRLVGQTVDKQRQARFRADAFHPRAAHPARKGDFQHLHQPGADRADGDHLHDRVRPRGAEGTGDAEPGEDGVRRRAVCQERPRCCSQGAPRFNEFVVQTERGSQGAQRAHCSDRRSSADFRLKKFYPELGNASLWCCTELTRKIAIDAAAQGVAR